MNKFGVLDVTGGGGGERQESSRRATVPATRGRSVLMCVVVFVPSIKKKKIPYVQQDLKLKLITWLLRV